MPLTIPRFTFPQTGKLKLLIVSAFAVLLSGCFSGSVIRSAKANLRETATFSPSAIYEDPDDQLIAIEGTKRWPSDRDNRSLTYVLLPRVDYEDFIATERYPTTNLLIRYSERRGTLSVLDEKLPAGFLLVPDDLGLSLTAGSGKTMERIRPSALLEFVVLPATLVWDTLTFPLQVLIYIAL